MGHRILFASQHNVILVKFDGVVTPSAMAGMIADTRKFMERHGACPGIVDFSSVERVDLDVEYVKAMGQSARLMRGQRRVLVAPGDEMFGLLRMYGIHQSGSGEDPDVVRSLATAYELLGVAEADFQPFVAE
jgi:hypothetical protein